MKDYFLKAGICHLATGVHLPSPSLHTTIPNAPSQDMVGTTRALEQYREMDPSFGSTREHQLLMDLSQTVEAGEQEQFADALFKFDQMSPLGIALMQVQVFVVLTE